MRVHSCRHSVFSADIPRPVPNAAPLMPNLTVELGMAEGQPLDHLALAVLIGMTGFAALYNTEALTDSCGALFMC